MRRGLSGLVAVLVACALAGSAQAAPSTSVDPTPLLASVGSEAQTVEQDIQKLLPEIQSESHREIAQLERLESEQNQLAAIVDEMRAKLAARQLSVTDIRKLSAAIAVNLTATRQVQKTLALRFKTAGTKIDPVLWERTIAAVRRLDVLDTRLQSQLLALKRACETDHPPALCK